MTLTERIAEIDAITAAILAGASGWPSGLWDAALKRLEATAETLLMTEQELPEMSAIYQVGRSIPGPTGAALMIERARRSTLSSHARLAEAVERRRPRE